MTEAGDVVQAGAIGRREIRRIRVQQMQGRHQGRQFLEALIDGAPGHKVGGRRPCRDQFGMAPGQYRAPVGQQRNLTGIFQQMAGILQTEQGRELVFPCHRGQMPGHAARFADQARSP